MAEISKSQLKAALSAIMEREQAEHPLSQTSQRADLSALRRTHHERLQSEFATAGFDFRRLDKLYNDYKEEARKLLEKHVPPVDSRSVKPTKSDQEWTANKKRVYELIAGRPLVTFPVVIDAPSAIYSIPSGSLVDSHIHNWNSWATWRHDDSADRDWTLPEGFETASVRFLFAWQNNTPNVVVIKRASVDLSIRGLCEAIATPPLINGSNVEVRLFAYHRVFMGQTIISGDRSKVAHTIAFTPGWIAGGVGDFETVDLDLVRHVGSHDVLVPSGQLAIFDVGVEAEYQIQNGRVVYVLAESGPGIVCPALILELSLVLQS